MNDGDKDNLYRIKSLQNALIDGDKNSIIDAHRSLSDLHAAILNPSLDSTNWLVIPSNSSMPDHLKAMHQQAAEHHGKINDISNSKALLEYSRQLLFPDNIATRSCAYGVATNNGKVLLTVDRGKDGREVWWLPGGGIDEGETHEDALRREINEETGLRVLNNTPLFKTRDVRSSASGDVRDTTRIIHKIDLSPGAITQEVGGSSGEAQWVPIDKAMNLKLAPWTRRAIEGE